LVYPYEENLSIRVPVITTQILPCERKCFDIPGVPRGEVNIAGGLSIGHTNQKKKKKKKLYMCMCPIPNGFRHRARDVTARIKERQDALRGATHHVLT
jgi:hypothetical protein